MGSFLRLDADLALAACDGFGEDFFVGLNRAGRDIYGLDRGAFECALDVLRLDVLAVYGKGFEVGAAVEGTCADPLYISADLHGCQLAIPLECVGTNGSDRIGLAADLDGGRHFCALAAGADRTLHILDGVGTCFLVVCLAASTAAGSYGAR